MLDVHFRKPSERRQNLLRETFTTFHTVQQCAIVHNYVISTTCVFPENHLVIAHRTLSLVFDSGIYDVSRSLPRTESRMILLHFELSPRWPFLGILRIIPSSNHLEPYRFATRYSQWLIVSSQRYADLSILLRHTF